jgi:hypothetical protein
MLTQKIFSLLSVTGHVGCFHFKSSDEDRPSQQVFYSVSETFHVLASFKMDMTVFPSPNVCGHFPSSHLILNNLQLLMEH